MKKIESKLLDSSAWLSYFFAQNEEIKGIVESNDILYTQTISLFEIKRKFLERQIRKDGLNKALNFIKERSIIVNLDEEIAEKAAEIAYKKKLHAIDSLIYATALSVESMLVTMDLDFKELEGVRILG
jgi:predicted nucleic acid-binding protein